MLVRLKAAVIDDYLCEQLRHSRLYQFSDWILTRILAHSRVKRPSCEVYFKAFAPFSARTAGQHDTSLFGCQHWLAKLRKRNLMKGAQCALARKSTQLDRNVHTPSCLISNNTYVAGCISCRALDIS